MRTITKLQPLPKEVSKDFNAWWKKTNSVPTLQQAFLAGFESQSKELRSLLAETIQLAAGTQETCKAYNWNSPHKFIGCAKFRKNPKNCLRCRMLKAWQDYDLGEEAASGS